MPAGWHNITPIDDRSVIRLQSQQSPEAGTYRPATRSIKRLSKRFDHRDPSQSLVLLIFRTRWHNRQRFWLWIKYAVRLGGWKRERSAYEFAWKRSMKDVKPDPRWQGQCLSVVYTWREREPYLLAWHQIAFELAVPTWQHLQGSERKGSPDLSPRAPLCLTTALSGDREWQTRTERGATSQRAQSFSPPAKCHSFRGYQQIV